MPMETQSGTVVLNIDRAEDRVLVRPEDNDLFTLRVKEAIEACKIFENLKSRFKEQLDSLKNRLGVWIEDHPDKIQHAILTLREDTFLFLVVMQQIQFDDDMEDDLSDLILEIASAPEYSAINFDAQVLPHCSEAYYQSFCNPSWVFTYRKRDGERQGAHQPSAT